MIYHVLPIDDLKKHSENSICECHPTSQILENGDILIIHNSYDGREFVEKLHETCKN